MAKKPAGYYSPEAIQGRQETARAEYEKAQQPEKVEKLERPQAIQAGGMLSPDKNPVMAQYTPPPPGFSGSSSYLDPRYRLPTVQQTRPNVPNALPYMAQDIANINTILGTQGTEAVYYKSEKPREGWRGTLDAVVVNPFKNWMRRTWAAIHDPNNYIPSPTAEQTALIEERVQQLKDKPINYQGHEVSPQQRAHALSLIGLNLDEVLYSQAVEDVARTIKKPDPYYGDRTNAGSPEKREEGKPVVNVTTGLVTRAVKEVAKTAAFGVLGAPEWVVRNGAAVMLTVDELADKAGGADKDMMQDTELGTIYTAVEKFNKAVRDDELYWLWKRVPVLSLLQTVPFANVLKQLTPVEFIQDAGRFIVNANKIPEGQFTETLNRNLSGSQMIYTMFYDQAKREEFQRRYDEGESPIKLTMELQNPIVEIAGGILYDPTTYLTGGAAKIKYADDGARLVSKGAQSASVSKIDDVLVDIRPVPSVQRMMNEFISGSPARSTTEMAAELRKVVSSTQEEFGKWINRRGLFTYTSSGKTSIVVEDATNLFKSLAAQAAGTPNAADELLKTIDSMKALAKNEGTEEAAMFLFKSPLGSRALSPQGMRIAHLMNSMDDALPGLLKAIDENDVAKVADVYASAIEKYANKTILSIDDMAAAAGKVDDLARKYNAESVIDAIRKAKTPEELKAANDAFKKLGGSPDELKYLLRAADDFKQLPKWQRFINGANFIGQRTWMLPMRGFAETYFGWNRFSYPVRNVVATVPAMAYEFGLGDATEIAAKSISGSQIEKLGTDTLKSVSSEIERLVGYLPPAAQRGDTAIGDFVTTSKKYFGKIRGGSAVAELSEQLMSAQIMLKTVKREISNAIAHGAIPNVQPLIDAGLNNADAQILLKFTKEYGGNVDETLDAFRRFMGGEVDAFRHVPMPAKLEQTLDEIGNGGNSLFKEMRELSKNAQTPAEFSDGAAQIWKKIEGMAEYSRTESTKLSDDVEEVFAQDIKTAQMFNLASPQTIDNFERTIQAFRNAKAKMVEVEETMKSFFGAPKEFAPLFTKARQEAEAANRVDPLRRLVNQIRDNKELNPRQMYDLLENSLPDFKISQLTEVDPAKLDRRGMERIMWESYYAWVGKHYADKANVYNKNIVAIFEQIAAKQGTTIADAARMSGAPFEQAIDEFKKAYQYYKQGNIDVMYRLRNTGAKGNLGNIDIDSLKEFGFKSQSHLFNEINRYRKTVGERPWQTFEQVEMWEIQDAVIRMKRSQGFVLTDVVDDVVKDGKWEPMLFPPIADDKAVTPARMIAESLPRIQADFDKYVQTVVGSWGEKTAPAGALSDSVEKALGGWVDNLSRNMGRAKTEAGAIASATRDALLFDYRKQLWQVAAQYVSPFSYYHVSASKAWFKNVAADPKWGAIYLDYKEYMAERHAGLPDYWKQNTAISLPGMDKNNPLFFNVESTLNPLYQMIGQDFSDPERRKNWFSSTVDDLGKIIPGMYQPLQWAVAASLYKDGEVEAAKRWMGRGIAQTKLLKSVSNALGLNLGPKYNEFDPIVATVDGGLDPYEERRALMVLAQMPGLTEEQRQLAAYQKSGDVWDEAVRLSLSKRAIPELMSFFLGVGFKPRTAEDIRVEQFYSDYRKLLAARSVMSPQEYQDAWEVLREQHPFMDTMIIGRRSGTDSDTAFAYAVFSRIPPGELTDIAEQLNVEPYMISSFYDNKGVDGMNEQDRARFMAAVLDAAVMLKMPSGTTRQEWNAAKDTYSSMNTQLQKRYGSDILDLMSKYLDPGTTTAEREAMILSKPQIEAALRAKDAYIVNTPILSSYYGSLDTVTRYFDNQIYTSLEREFGKDHRDIYDEYLVLNKTAEREQAYAEAHNLDVYWDREAQLDKNVISQLETEFGMEYYDVIAEWKVLKLRDKDAAKQFYRENNIRDYEQRKKALAKEVDALLIQEFGDMKSILNEYKALKLEQNEEAKKFYREHNLEAYEARKDELYDQSNERIMTVASQIPEREGYTIREDFKPESGLQKQAFEYATGDQNAQIAQVIWDQLTPASQELLQDYYSGASDEEVPYSVRQQIEYLADKFDLSSREALLLLGVETP